MLVATKRTCVLALLALAACGTAASVIRTNAPPRPLAPRSSESVEVITTGRPSRPSVEVAIIEVQQQSIYSTDDTAAVFQALRNQAAQTGCDALFLIGSNDAVQGGYNNATGTAKGYRGACLVWTDAPAAAPATADAPK